MERILTNWALGGKRGTLAGFPGTQSLWRDCRVPWMGWDSEPCACAASSAVRRSSGARPARLGRRDHQGPGASHKPLADLFRWLW